MTGPTGPARSVHADGVERHQFRLGAVELSGASREHGRWLVIETVTAIAWTAVGTRSPVCHWVGRSNNRRSKLSGKSGSGVGGGSIVCSVKTNRLIVGLSASPKRARSLPIFVRRFRRCDQVLTIRCQFAVEAASAARAPASVCVWSVFCRPSFWQLTRRCLPDRSRGSSVRTLGVQWRGVCAVGGGDDLCVHRINHLSLGSTRN